MVLVDEGHKERWSQECSHHEVAWDCVCYLTGQVMLGPKALGVLRVHLPGLVHKWHEKTPWKCLVWVWSNSPTAGGGGCEECDKYRMFYERGTIAQALGA